MFRRFFLEVSLWFYTKVYNSLVYISDTYENLLDEICFDDLEDREDDPIFQNQIEALDFKIEELEYQIIMMEPFTPKEQAEYETERLNRVRKIKDLPQHDRIYTCEK